MMKITGLSHLFKWENLHNWWLTNTFLPHCMNMANESINNLNMHYFFKNLNLNIG